MDNNLNNDDDSDSLYGSDTETEKVLMEEYQK
jgi:hypothetical protein